MLDRTTQFIMPPSDPVPTLVPTDTGRSDPSTAKSSSINPSTATPEITNTWYSTPRFILVNRVAYILSRCCLRDRLQPSHHPMDERVHGMELVFALEHGYTSSILQAGRVAVRVLLGVCGGRHWNGSIRHYLLCASVCCWRYRYGCRKRLRERIWHGGHGGLSRTRYPGARPESHCNMDQGEEEGAGTAAKDWWSCEHVECLTNTSKIK
ncbi:hypothetical protein BCR44DRAFT_29107 [Catenaria anguillulae PL171]|uniref:Uncharacterized protein n=1 Tax=Catenaria anguillulae PL171 TaxID=765915 RepID=A0A1Y2HHB3_9FUNG|nr:hypothetical protein BCR44DRAFT_29107 [Catenaria anguillulae PL171]